MRFLKHDIADKKFLAELTEVDLNLDELDITTAESRKMLYLESSDSEKKY